MHDEHLLEHLTSNKMLPTSSANLVRQFSAQWNRSIYQSLLQTHVFTSSTLADALAKVLKLPRVYHLQKSDLSMPHAKLIGYKRAKAWEVLPLKPQHEEEIELGFVDPTKKSRIASLEKLLDLKVCPVVLDVDDVTKLVDEVYDLEDQLPQFFSAFDEQKPQE